jgi:hypothetical protein
MREILASAGIGLFCGLLLNVFYVVVKHEWPANYFGIGGSVDPIISRNVIRYSLFRLAPPAIAALAAATTAERANGHTFVTVAVVLVVHLVRVVLASAREVKRGQILKGASSLLVVILVVGISTVFVSIREFFAPLIPSPGDLVANLWAGLLAAIGAVYLQRVSMVRRTPASLAYKSLLEMPRDVLHYAVKKSFDCDVDSKVVLSIMIAENMQRPKWFRRLELKTPGNKDERTTGIMQQRGATSDQNSIDLAFQKYFMPYAPCPSDTYERDDWCRARIEQYNQNESYRELVFGIYYVLREEDSMKGLNLLYRDVLGEVERMRNPASDPI